MNVRIIQNITKEYPDMFKVVVYREPRYLIEPENRIKRNKNVVNEDYTPEISSLSRTKTLVRDIVLCNDFDLFATFTFDPDKVNRYSYSECWGKFQRWIHHQKERSPELKYLLVPEQHKDGAWHFHALISHFKGSLRDSKHKTGTGRNIFNITSYRSGFSTAVYIDNKEAVSHYVTKYITKDFIKKFNQRRFTCSRNLIRPVKTINSPVLSFSLPLMKERIYESLDFELYNVAKF